ncbi:ZIP-like iron-zinc transporter [Coniophora puteana RWD-64-598 SS2]|uniref:ZIP-like iron-zinc transporter n=1 Tax=Coniophora puteana (strain RWD-64-598) TaxID=741705 RepID=A0A5M3MJC1_CONPW|nr:ZIP-like iron-zinc transporter [Coniophora puteana RWD-64-598 SS2]EIW79087.1 ZIP-like iron-zinc transporter [Coniophora puteana RWD-64-598 SS2]
MSSSSAASTPTATPDADNSVSCSPGGGASDYTQLRIAAIFIIMCTSMFGALFPVLARRTQWLAVPKGVFDFAKYFGSGVIIATAFIHLLSPALDELSNDCLSPAWQDYPYALALAMLSLYSIFIVELIAFRWGNARLAALGVKHDAHGHGLGGHAAHGPEGNTQVATAGNTNDPLRVDSPVPEKSIEDDKEAQHEHTHVWDHSAVAQVIGICILEFGIELHSFLIGMTLAVDPDFKVLFVVIVFHQMFEGLGLGSRLAFMNLPRRLNYVPIVGALLYGFTTPLGIAVGMGIRTTYNPNTPTASIVSGVMDSLSAGILLYTGLVELLAHEFLFNKEMHAASNGKLAYALICMLLGTGIMALLGRWA